MGCRCNSVQMKEEEKLLWAAKCRETTCSLVIPKTEGNGRIQHVLPLSPLGIPCVPYHRHHSELEQTLAVILPFVSHCT